MTVRSEAEKHRDERRRNRASISNSVKWQNDCADGRHRYGCESPLPEFKGRRMCACGAVEGELPS